MHKITPIGKKEILGLAVIFLFIFIFSFFNFRIALRRARDVQRKNDISTLQQGLDKYLYDFRLFPVSNEEGQIVACRGPETYWDEEYEVWENLVGCEWGKDALADFSDPTYPSYIPLLPRDPKYQEGINYRYISNGNRYQIYIYLEGESDEAEYSPKIVDFGVMCGKKICNYGKAYSETPLDKSIEEYENELEANKKR